MSKRTSTRGPIAGHRPSTYHYKCPVKDCKSVKIRGDDIPKHFRTHANLIALDQANENFVQLRKTNVQSVLANSDAYLNDLLPVASLSEKEHTKYLFQHGYSSMSLPKCESINFKCQYKNNTPLPVAFSGFAIVPKKAKLSGNSENKLQTCCIVGD